MHSNWYTCMSYRLCWLLVSEIRMFHPDPASKQLAKPVWHTRIPIAVCTVLDSWWWTENLSETCRVLYIVHIPTNALLLNLEKFKIYKTHKYRSYVFRSSTIIRDLVQSLAKVIFLLISINSISQALYKLPYDGRRPKHVGAIFMCLLM